MTDNSNQHFSNVKPFNFDIIYNDIQISQLQKLLEEYHTTHKNDFNRYDQKRKDEIVSAAYRPERKDVFLRMI